MVRMLACNVEWHLRARGRPTSRQQRAFKLPGRGCRVPGTEVSRRPVSPPESARTGAVLP